MSCHINDFNRQITIDNNKYTHLTTPNSEESQKNFPYMLWDVEK